MDFLAGVNRIFRQEGIVREDGEITSFTGNSFGQSTELAKIAIQNEINDLTSEEYIPYEEAESTITLGADTRTYSLASDFIRFRDRRPKMLEVDGSGNSENRLIFDYPGGEEKLRQEVYDYRDQTGDPSWFYFVRGASKQVGFYLVPDASAAGKIYRYYYEKSVNVSVETDTLPFASEGEAQAFIDLAATRFRYMRADEVVRTQLYPRGLSSIPDRTRAESKLLSLMRPNAPARAYGRKVIHGADDYI